MRKQGFVAAAMLALIICCTALLFNHAEAYQVGVGRADATGPPVEIRFVRNVF